MATVRVFNHHVHSSFYWLALVDALEALYAFETGLTPPLSYGPNRRIGARGAHVVAVDLVNKSYQPVGGWHELR